MEGGKNIIEFCYVADGKCLNAADPYSFWDAADPYSLTPI